MADNYIVGNQPFLESTSCFMKTNLESKNQLKSKNVKLKVTYIDVRNKVFILNYEGEIKTLKIYD